MSPKTRAISAALMLLLAGCATQKDLQYVQGDMDEVKSRLFKIEKDLSGVKVETRGSVEGALKNTQQETVSVRKSVADLQAALETSRVDMQVLTGKIEDMKLLSRKPLDEISLLREDVRLRLASAEERIKKQELALDELRKQLATAGEKETEKSPEYLYQNGLDTLRAGDLSKARTLFLRFIEVYPRHDLAANAHYWLGETYYSEKNFEQAILEFQEVIKNFSGKEKVPAAMLKQGLAFQEIKDIKSAKYILKKLVDTHPSSDEAKKAKEKLKELK